jgi:hypothetical protein
MELGVLGFWAQNPKTPLIEFKFFKMELIDSDWGYDDEDEVVDVFKDEKMPEFCLSKVEN